MNNVKISMAPPLTDKQDGGEAGSVTGNSHHITANSTSADGDIRNNKHSKGEEEEETQRSGGKSQEKSVLQAKLTKLAIQIGYAGEQKLSLIVFCTLIMHMDQQKSVLSFFFFFA